MKTGGAPALDLARCFIKRDALSSERKETQLVFRSYRQLQPATRQSPRRKNEGRKAEPQKEDLFSNSLSFLKVLPLPLSLFHFYTTIALRTTSRKKSQEVFQCSACCHFDFCYSRATIDTQRVVGYCYRKLFVSIIKLCRFLR